VRSPATSASAAPCAPACSPGTRCPRAPTTYYTDANQRSIIQANQLADAQVAKMKSDDENTRADLISRINAGMDADSAAAAAAQRMAINRQQALSEPSSKLLNNLFAGIGNAWNQYQFANGAANPYGNMQKSVGGLGGYGGRIS